MKPFTVEPSNWPPQSPAPQPPQPSQPRRRAPWARITLSLTLTAVLICLSWRDAWGSCPTIGSWMLAMLLCWGGYEY